MSMIQDIKKSSVTTLALGAGVLSLLPAVLPVAARGVRPLLNTAIQGGLVCLEKGQEAIAEIHRLLDHMSAEAKAETQSVHRSPPVDTAMAPSAATTRTEPQSRPIMAMNGEPDPEVMG